MNEQIKHRIKQIQCDVAPEGYKKTKRGIIPSDWKEECLSDYLIQHNEISKYSNQYPVLTSSRKGIFLQSDYYNKDIASEDNTGYNVVPYEYFTYRHMSDDEIFKFNINNLVPKGIVSTLYPVFTTTEYIDKNFLKELLNNGRDFRRYAVLQKQGGSRTYMYFAKLQKLIVAMPSLPEQQKIAEILTTCDKVIELKEKRIAEKRRQKKYLMQQLLTGRKRLAGFVGEWNVFKLNQFSKRITTRNENGNTNILTISAQFGLISQAEFFNKEVASENKEAYFLLKQGDFAYNKSYSNGYPYGAIKRLNKYKDGIVSPLYICFRVISDDVADKYLEQYFEAGLMNREIQVYAQEGARNHGLLNISTTDFFNSKIRLPGLQEQKEIIAILATADQELELLQNDLEQEKQKKKALMQLLLTGIVRVNP